MKGEKQKKSVCRERDRESVWLKEIFKKKENEIENIKPEEWERNRGGERECEE